MGRFYQTARPEFVENFEYQPPWELMKEGLLKKDEEISNTLDKLEFYRDVPIEHVPWEAQYAEQAKQQYVPRVEELAERFNADPLNPQYGSQLNSLIRDVGKDFSSGTISQILKNAEKFKQYEKGLGELKSDASKEMYRDIPLLHQQAEREQGRLLPFEPDQMYETKNLPAEFIGSKSFEALKDNEKTEFEVAVRTGNWYDFSKTKNELDIQRIRRAYEGFITGSDELPGYFKSMDKYGKNPMKYLDEKGQVSFAEGTRLKKELDDLLPYAHKKESEIGQADAYRLAATKSSAKTLKGVLGANATQSDVNKHILEGISLDNTYEAFSRPLQRLALKINEGIMTYKAATGSSIQPFDSKNPMYIHDLFVKKMGDFEADAKKMLSENQAKLNTATTNKDQTLINKYTRAVEEAKKAEMEFSNYKANLINDKEGYVNASNATWKPFYESFPEKLVKQMQEQAKAYVNGDEAAATEGVVDLGGFMINGMNVRDKGFYTGETGVNGMVGQILFNPETKEAYRIKSAEIKKDLIQPILMSRVNSSANYFRMVVEFQTDQNVPIVVPVYSSMGKFSPTASFLDHDYIGHLRRLKDENGNPLYQEEELVSELNRLKAEEKRITRVERAGLKGKSNEKFTAQGWAKSSSQKFQNLEEYRAYIKDRIAAKNAASLGNQMNLNLKQNPIDQEFMDNKDFNLDDLLDFKEIKGAEKNRAPIDVLSIMTAMQGGQ